MKQLSAIVTDPEMGGSAFHVSRKTYTRELGEVILSAVAGFTAAGSVQPASSEDLALLPQEERSEDTIILLSPFHFRLGEVSDLDFTTTDEIVWRGQRYRVIKVKSWGPQGGYYKAWAVRQRPQRAQRPSG